jgi:hypothetical protein
MDPVSQKTAAYVTTAYTQATTALLEAAKKVGSGIATISISLFAPPLAGVAVTLLNPGEKDSLY